MWAAYPPLGWGVLGFVAPIPLFLGLRMVERGPTALGVGFTYGFVFFGLMLNYVRFVGFVAWIPLTVLMAAWAAGYGLLVWVFRYWPPTRWWLIVVGGWGLWEFLRVHVPFGGFPWGTLGYSTGSVEGFIGAAQWVGPSGWSILTVAVAAGAALVIEDRSNWRLLVDPAVVVMLIALGGSLFAPSADGETLKVAIIQGNTPCPQTRCQNENVRIYQSHLLLTQSLSPEDVDLVVWPENSTGGGFDPVTNAEVLEELAAEAQRLDAYMLISGTRGVSPEEFLNVNVMISSNGNIVGEYAKRHPVPFGEFVPLRAALDFIPQLDRVPRDMARGEEAVVFELPGGTLGSLISFEGSFARLMRDEIDAGAELMVVATNESTYIDSPASDQLINITSVNAAAMGVDLVLAAITGRSVIMKADGELVGSTGVLTTEVLLGEVQFRTAGKTLYARFGDWLLLVSWAAAAAALLVPGEGRPERGRKGS
jgi:apolipoprotein N-acyltransferase